LPCPFAFIHSLDEVILLFYLCLASAFETQGIALPWQIQVFWRDLHSLPGGEVPPAPGLNSLSCSEKYLAEQLWQDRLVQGCFHLPVPSLAQKNILQSKYGKTGLSKDASIFLCPRMHVWLSLCNSLVMAKREDNQVFLQTQLQH
uniref:Uncharacterized protein n=1 Tax=Ficedula albicollis TaxID=59894 RepID=A0A803VCI2_FICAL